YLRPLSMGIPSGPARGRPPLSAKSSFWRSIVLENGDHWSLGQASPTLEAFEFDDECEGLDDATLALDQLGCGGRSSPRCQEIIHDHHPGLVGEGIPVHFEFGLTVLEGVRHGVRRRR